MAERLNALEIAVVVETAGLNTSSTSENHAMCTVRHVYDTNDDTNGTSQYCCMCGCLQHVWLHCLSMLHAPHMVTFDHLLSAVDDNNYMYHSDRRFGAVSAS